MQNYVLYFASSQDEIYECCYSLLKYLDVYNLKPPVDHSLVLYSAKPALLEAYGSYLNSFELKEIQTGKANEESGMRNMEVKEIFEQYKGNILYLPPNAYPVKELEPLFAAMNKGAVYKGQTETSSHANPSQLPILGFNNGQQDADFIMRSSRSNFAGEFIEQYENLKEFRELLRDFFKRYQEESVPNQVKLMHSINARQIQDQKNKFSRLPLYQRLLRKILGKGWSISKHAKLS